MPPPAPLSDVASAAPLVYPPRERSVDATPRDLTAELNREQAAAATHGAGPLLIIAGAGTGKTRTLVYRMALLIERGVPPERILLLTFTRRAAHEMLSRAERLVGSASTRVQGGTFHATGHRLLRQFGPEAGLARNFSIMDQGDAEDLMQLARGSLGFGRIRKAIPEKGNAALRLLPAHQRRDPDRDADRARGPAVPRADAGHDPRLRRVREPEVGAEPCRLRRPAAVLGDDARAVAGARRPHRGTVRPHPRRRVPGHEPSPGSDPPRDVPLPPNITVVGDDAQSIYSFRGASFRNILDFPKQFPGRRRSSRSSRTTARRSRFSTRQTRSSRAPLSASPRTLWTERDGGEPPWLVTARDEQQQTRFVVDRVLELHEEGMPLREMAVLVRAGYMSRRPRDRAHQPQDPVREVGRPQVPRGGARQGRARVPARARQPARRGELVPDPHADARHRRRHGACDDETMADRSWDPDAFARLRAAGARARRASRSGRLCCARSARRRRDEAAAASASDIDAVRLLYDGILARTVRSRPSRGWPTSISCASSPPATRAARAFLAALALEPPQSTQDLAGRRAKTRTTRSS